jgi:hypothetical protein
VRPFALAAPLLLVLTACAPEPGRQADICAIQALPARPGVDAFGTAPDIEQAAQTKGAVYGPGMLLSGPIRWWGRCPSKADTTDMILIGPGPWALTKGGPRADGRPLGYGTCYHRDDGQGWRTLACRINP